MQIAYTTLKTLIDNLYLINRDNMLNEDREILNIVIQELKAHLALSSD